MLYQNVLFSLCSYGYDQLNCKKKTKTNFPSCSCRRMMTIKHYYVCLNPLCAGLEKKQSGPIYAPESFKFSHFRTQNCCCICEKKLYFVLFVAQVASSESSVIKISYFIFGDWLESALRIIQVDLYWSFKCYLHTMIRW